MPLLNDKIQSQVRKTLEDMTGPVKLVMFTQASNALECEMCAETRALVEEVAALAPAGKLSVEVHDFLTDTAAVESYKVDKIPAIAIVGAKDYGIRYYGIPSGYEFSSLMDDILTVSKGESGLSAATKSALAKIAKPIHIQVYVTPTCPYCPRAVVLAHRLALESDWITADMVEATEFPHLANKYEVYSVPRTVINETIHVEGAVPEPMLVNELMKALD